MNLCIFYQTTSTHFCDRTAFFDQKTVYSMQLNHYSNEN